MRVLVYSLMQYSVHSIILINLILKLEVIEMTSYVIDQVDRQLRAIEQGLIEDPNRKIRSGARHLRILVDREKDKKEPKHVCRIQNLFHALQKRIKGGDPKSESIDMLTT